MRQHTSGSLPSFVFERKRVENTLILTRNSAARPNASKSKEGNLSCHIPYTWVFCVSTLKCCQSL